ncbi:MAG TPA: universal stress protein [Chloroflexota bacterium]|nr:universal stress protein [Chloroflexota bacterium]
MNVLIALDGSETSDQALDLACTLLSGKGANVTLLHVIPRHMIYGRGGPVVAECYDPNEEQEHSKELLVAAEQRLREKGVSGKVTKELEVGDPADLILAIAAQDNVDLIVLGSRGLNAAQRFLLGSVSTKVTTHAHCAVLVAHPRVRPLPAEAAALGAVVTA